MKKLLILMMMALTFGAMSCQKSNIEPLPDNGPGDVTKGEQTQVTLKLTATPMTVLGDETKSAGDAIEMSVGQAQTKSTTELEAEEEDAVMNLWILQFNKSDGKANGDPIYLDDTKITQTDADVLAIPVELKVTDNAQVIYVIANTGDEDLFSGTSAPADTAALNKLAFAAASEFKPTAETGIPMFGRIDMAKVNSVVDPVTVKLDRLFAKVKFKLTSGFSGYTISGVQLKNVAANAYYRPAQTTAVDFPAIVTGTNPSHVDYPSEAYKTEEYVWYVPENLRKTATTTSNVLQRTIEKTDGKGAYIEVVGTRNTNTPVTYQFLLGDIAKAVGDYNVRRNYAYTLGVNIKGASLTDYRITQAGPANSFMVFPGRTLNFNAKVRGNGGNVASTGLATAIAPSSVALVWQDATGLITNANSTNRVIPYSSATGLATVETKKATYGNALIAAYDGPDGTGTILWSWHIWVTNYRPMQTVSIAPNTQYAAMDGSSTTGYVHTYGERYLAANPGKVIMDRNLGATYNGTLASGTISAANAPKAFGQLYQWGRKDPLGQAASTSAFAPWYNAAGTAVTSANTAGPVTLTVAYQNPTTFYYSSSGDWLSAQNGNLWGNGGAKTIFDPCPAGWKVAKGGPNGTWNAFTSTGGDVASFQGSNEPYTGTTFPYFINGVQQTASGQYSTYVRNGRLYQQGAVKAWYPGEGYRIYSSGILNSVGNSGYSWGSGVSGNSSYHFSFSYDTIWPRYSGNRSSGLPVRCIQE